MDRRQQRVGIRWRTRGRGFLGGMSRNGTGLGAGCTTFATAGSHEGLRILLREEGVSFQRLKTWKTSRDPEYAAKKARVGHLYAIADGEATPEEGEPEIVFCVDEFDPSMPTGRTRTTSTSSSAIPSGDASGTSASAAPTRPALACPGRSFSLSPRAHRKAARV